MMWANDTGQKVNVDKTKYINTSKHKHKKKMQSKTHNINNEEHKYQNLNIWVHWLLWWLQKKCLSKN
jgi:hypothetical protein